MKGWTSTTCRGRRSRWRSMAHPPSRSRRRSASVATTPCCAWRLREDSRCALASRGSVRPGGETPAGGVMTLQVTDRAEKLSPVERLEALCDRGSLTLLRSNVVSRRMGDRAQPGDGVIAGAGRVDGRPIFCYAQDPSYLGGSLGQQHADSIVRVLQLAGRANAPVVGFIESGGARMQEGTAALAGYARIFREHVALSGRVPQISVICGASAGGGSYSPALTDFVVMTERANMFLTRPPLLREGLREGGTAAQPRGHKVHERNGVAHFVAADDSDAALLVRDLLDHLPSHTGDRAPRWRPAGPPGYTPVGPVPDSDRSVYDVRDVARGVL